MSVRACSAHFFGASGFFLIVNAICAVLHWLLHVHWFDGAVPDLQIIFLPFGALVLLTWFYGWVMVPLLLPAAVLSQAVAYGGLAFDAEMMQVMVLKLLAFPLVFGVFRLGGIDARGGMHAMNWRVLVLVGLLASILLSVLRHLFAEWNAGMAAAAMLNSMMATVIEDMIGLMLVMFGLMLVFRRLRQI